MKIFVLTDNKKWLKKSREILNLPGISVSYFCSPNGSSVFRQEINQGLITPINLKKDFQRFIDQYQLGFSLHCKQIFPSQLVDNILCINVHPGLNPYNRGWFPQVFSIINKYPVGATIHIMDSQVDHGEIIVQKEVEVFDSDTSKSVYERILETEFILLEENIHNILSSKYNSIPMESEGNYNSIEDYKSLLEIDMEQTLTMRDAIDFLRALTHEPYNNAYFIDCNGKKVFVSIALTVKE